MHRIKDEKDADSPAARGEEAVSILEKSLLSKVRSAMKAKKTKGEETFCPGRTQRP